MKLNFWQYEMFSIVKSQVVKCLLKMKKLRRIISN